MAKFKRGYSTDHGARPNNPAEKYGEMWASINFNLEGARRHYHTKKDVPVIGTLEIGGKSFDITWSEANRIIRSLEDGKHQYNVAQRMGMLEPGTGTPIPISSQTY